MEYKTKWHRLVCTGPWSCKDMEGCKYFKSYWLSWDCRQEEKLQHMPKDSESGLKMLTLIAKRRSFYHKTPSGRCKAEGSFLAASVGSACLALLILYPASTKLEGLSVHTPRHVSGSSWVGAKPWQAWVPSALSSPLTIRHEVHEPCDIFSKLSYSLWTERASLVSTSSKYEVGGEGREVSKI